MRKRNSLVILGFFVFVGCVTTSQLAKLPLHSITGKVTDNNGKPIKAAIVTTTPPSSSVLTDKDGNYAIRKLSSRDFIVHVSKHGYVEGSATLRVGGYDNPTRGDIRLLLQRMVLE